MADEGSGRNRPARPAGAKPQSGAQKPPSASARRVAGKPGQGKPGGPRVQVVRPTEAPGGRWMRWVVILAIALAGWMGWRAINRPRASPAYAEAAALFETAQKERGEDVWDDARLDRVLALLASVPGDSLDNEAARGLGERIRVGRADLARLRALRQPAEPVPVAAEPSTFAFPSGPGAASAPAAPTDVPLTILVGDSMETVRKKFGACLTEVEPFLERGGGGRGMVWGLSELGECPRKHPDLKGQLVYVLGERVFNVGARQQAERVAYLPDGGVAFVNADSVPATRAAAPAPAAASPDAGSPAGGTAAAGP